MLRSTLLSIHLLAVIVWLGCGLYELLLYRDIRRRAGTGAEFYRLSTWFRYAAIIPVATVLVAISGVLMSSLLGWGYFGNLWLAVKQILMIVILLAMLRVGPTMIRLNRRFRALPLKSAVVPSDIRDGFAKAAPWFMWMRIGGLVAALLSVYRLEY